MFDKKLLMLLIFTASVFLCVSSVSATDNLINETIEDIDNENYVNNNSDVISKSEQNISMEINEELILNNFENPNVLKEVNDLIFNNTFTPIYSDSVGTWNGSDSDIPAFYDLRKEGFVSSVKDQSNGTTCWAFAALGALESCVLKATGVEYDFSEENLKNLESKYSGVGYNDNEPNNGSGGNLYMAISYLASWFGAVNEATDSYNTSEVYSSKLNNVVNIQNVYIIPKNSDKNVIKRAILNYGGVVASYFSISTYYSSNHSENYYNPNYGSYDPNYNKDTDGGHDIVIVGWDDNYQASNFTEKGAWIVKNSWGTDDGDNGYFYISYNDTSLAKINPSYTFILNDSAKYNKNYQYDTQRTDVYDSKIYHNKIYCFNFTKNGENHYDMGDKFYYYKNVFNSTGNETLVSIASYFDKDVNYTINITKNGEQVSFQSFRSNIEGYFTVKLNNNVTLNEGDKFEVIIYNSNPTFSVCRQKNVNNTLPEDVSFVSTDGKTWKDSVKDSLVSGNYNFNGNKFNYSDFIDFNKFVNCIKAFTINNGGSLADRNSSCEIVCTDLTKYYGCDDNLNVNLKFSNGLSADGALISGRNITFTFNGLTSVSKTDKDGNAVLNLDKNLKPGNYLVSIHYTDAYNNITINVTVTIKERFNLISNNLVKYYGHGDNLVATLTSNDGSSVSGKTIIFTINSANRVLGTYTSTTGKDGNAVLNLDNFNPGDYKVFICYNDGGYTIKSNVTVTVISIIYNLNSSGLSKFYKNDARLYATLTSNDNSSDSVNNKLIFFEINGVRYNRTTNSNGVVSIAINLDAGVYPVSISYNNITINVIVNIKSTIETADVMKYYKNGTQYYATFYDSDGNLLVNTIVTFNIHGVFYNRTTDENGTARLNINLDSGEYIITAFNPVNNESIGNNITVKSVLIGKDVNMTYKDGTKYKVQLVDGQGNPLAGKEVKLNIHGVVYKKITNATGFAELNLNLGPGEYIMTVTYEEGNYKPFTSNIIIINERK